MNRRDGVVVLSRNAGAFERLEKHVLAVSPFDIEEMADALHAGLSMPANERATMARGVRRVVASHPMSRWVGRQLADLERAAAGRTG